MSLENKILIPSRIKTPETYLYTKVIEKEIGSLGSRATLLLAPGGPGGNHSVFNGISEKLLDFADLILFDPRGCGYSDPSDAQYCTLEHYIDDIEAVRNHFHQDNIILLGGSYGSMASIGYAIKYPSHLSKLILLAGAPSGKFIETAKENLAKRGTTEQKLIAEKKWRGEFKTPEEFTDYYKKMMSLYLIKPNTDLPTTKPGIPYNIEINNLGFSSFLRTFNFEDDLEKITCNTLIICGAQDWINDPQHARVIADKIPKATLHIFEECGHFVWGDQPELFFSAVEEFLSGELTNNL